ncbi:ABC transporter permease [Saccharospirillum sp. MSK14-1]|uniref:ABC transporter permease n=1 Tax=Saccharospirillum sp. MSK14-1 TaxID=1897632 RepID=UPI001E2CE0B0|nr:iron chelate uptake ABC transporter family permease subunit [Saccharospirillum sp. MSK14-1]
MSVNTLSLPKRRLPLWWLALPVFLLLFALSLLIGVAELHLTQLGERDLQILLISRLPRTLALVLAGMSLAVAGLLMQMLARNRFVEPSTTGTVECAMLGLLLVTLLAPAMPVMGKMLIASVFALAGSLVFMALLRAVPLHSTVMVPLIGIMFGGVVGAVIAFIAYRLNLMQSVANWTNGDFSAILRGRYELLWIGAALAVIAYLTADRFTVAGMGRDFATNLGLNYRWVLLFGLAIVSMISAVTVVTTGVIPFLGLVVPNVVSLMMGDHLRRSLPWVAIMGAALVLACDILGRLLRYPYEIPIGTVFGVIGSAFFIYLLLRRSEGRS